jgi:hypothetical protein
MRWLEGAADHGEVGEDTREERRGQQRSGGVRGRGAAHVAVACRGGRQEVCVGWVEEPVQEAARVLSYEQAASGCVSCLEEGEEELTFRPACKREGGNNLCGQLCCWPFGPGRGIERGTELLFF